MRTKLIRVNLELAEEIVRIANENKTKLTKASEEAARLLKQTKQRRNIKF